LLKLLIAGDEFIPSALFERHVKCRLSHLGLEITRCDLTQEASLANLPDIREYSGDPNLLISKSSDVDAIITSFGPITASVIDSANRLKVIACGRGGPVNVNVGRATEKKIPVIYCPGRNADAVADYVLGLILCLSRNILQADRYVRSGEWANPREDTFEKPSGSELQDKTLGIIGFGQVGSRVRERAKGFGLRVLICDPFILEKTEEFVDLDTLLVESDIITLHARLADPLTPLLGAREFSRMKKGALFINTSRGTAVDETALCDALEGGPMAGAALDVFLQEPIPLVSRFLSFDNLILTPHVAGVSLEIPERTCKMLADDLGLFFEGKRPHHVINPEVYELQ